jgi:hypothetical protein
MRPPPPTKTTTIPNSETSAHHPDHPTPQEGFTFTKTQNTISRTAISHSELLSLDEIVKIVERSTNTLAEDVEGDGLCLIHAINKAREPLQPIPKEIARKLITDFYATTLIGQQSGITAERILRIQTHWLEDDAILALTHLLQCNIEVYNINTTRLKGSIDIALHQPEGSFNLPTVKILLLNDVHFQALKDNSTASPPPKASLPPSSAIPVVAQSPVLLSSKQHRSTTL